MAEVSMETKVYDSCIKNEAINWKNAAFYKMPKPPSVCEADRKFKNYG